MLQVPVVNKSSEVVHVTADLRGGEAFSGPKDLMVGPGQTAVYPLTFRAPWIGDYVGNLELDFPATGVCPSHLSLPLGFMRAFVAGFL